MSDSGHDQWGPGTGSSADYGYGEPTAPRYSRSPFTSAPHTTSPFGEAPPAVPGAPAAGAPAPYAAPPPPGGAVPPPYRAAPPGGATPAPPSATPPPYGAVTAPYGAAPVPRDPYAGGYPASGHVRRSNTLATLSLVFSVAGIVTNGLTAIVGVILGHIARSQITRSGENGANTALAGLIIGYCILGFAVLIWVGVLASAVTG